MNKGGCAATTAAEMCLLLQKYSGISGLYPYDPEHVTFDDFNSFALTMKPYLRPRLTGVDRLTYYTEGLGRYFQNAGVTGVTMEEYSGDAPFDEAARTLTDQIDRGIPVPFLLLGHTDNALYDFIWHWFLLNGYRSDENGLAVKAASYGEYVWLDFEHLWNTGFQKKGGMILFYISKEHE